MTNKSGEPFIRDLSSALVADIEDARAELFELCRSAGVDAAEIIDKSVPK